MGETRRSEDMRKTKELIEAVQCLRGLIADCGGEDTLIKGAIIINKREFDSIVIILKYIKEAK